MASKNIDWEAIYREYRAGQLSNVEIGKQYGVSEGAIRKKAKIENWQKDLAKTVRERVREKLVRDEVRKSSASDSEIIQAAVERGAAVQSIHRKDSRQQQEIVQRLIQILQERLSEVEKPSLDHLRSCGSTMRDLSQALAKLVIIERQAYNLDEDGRRPDAIEEINITVVSPEPRE